MVQQPDVRGESHPRSKHDQIGDRPNSLSAPDGPVLLPEGERNGEICESGKQHLPACRYSGIALHTPTTGKNRTERPVERSKDQAGGADQLTAAGSSGG